jgi:hypothetical protein
VRVLADAVEWLLYLWMGADERWRWRVYTHSWSQDFLKAGGYSALLTRLNELLEVEWR